VAVIRVPKTPKKAYDPQRRAGTLLQSQLVHLEWAVRPASARSEKAFQIKRATTEAAAARRIEQLTIELHRQSALRAAEPTAAPYEPPRMVQTVRKPTVRRKTKASRAPARKTAKSKKRKKR
jgi:hypothetical protein